ncbi:ferredoxin [Kitasatospora sp. GAS1066B]|uniref:ferredoxin n=1 Tax=Kitasatospora sp. GAS1066B TaxID=3156271 RepID=UPI0035122443
MHVTVDQDRCCSSGQCVLTAPDVFDQSEEDGLVLLLQDRPDPVHLPKLRTAAALCPGGAITIHAVHAVLAEQAEHAEQAERTERADRPQQVEGVQA